MSNSQMNCEFLTTDQLAGVLGLKKNTLEGWRTQGRGPAFIKVGRAIRYRKTDIDDYLKNQTVRSTSEGTRDNISRLSGNKNK